MAEANFGEGKYRWFSESQVRYEDYFAYLMKRLSYKQMSSYLNRLRYFSKVQVSVC